MTSESSHPAPLLGVTVMIPTDLLARINQEALTLHYSRDAWIVAVCRAQFAEEVPHAA